MKKLVKLVKVNNLQYNTNRDPKVYRRAVNETFRVQALLDGSGSAKATFAISDADTCEQTVSLPGTFECNVKFADAKSRIGTLTVEGNGETYTQPIRLDTLAGEQNW